MMSQQKTPDELCRNRYATLACESQKGLNPSKINTAAQQECQRTDGRWFLKPEAFLPTGIALGNPVPDMALTERLWRSAQRLEEQIRKEHPETEKAFAFVPPEAYHISVVHHSHFEHSTEITPIPAGEKYRAQELIFEQKIEPIGIRVSGLLLTPEGRLIAPGFPADERFYRLRKLLADNISSLGSFVPNTAHIKLGHLLTPLAGKALQRVLSWLNQQGQSINTQLYFDDLFSPTGRISLHREKNGCP